jgi:hypothetical protein
MEGSMKMMSWSRYHCLSWSFMRVAHPHRALKIRAARVCRNVPRSKCSQAGRLKAKWLRFVVRMFRTKAQSGYTDA